MPLRRVAVAWTTGIGGVGVSNFYSLEATDITVSLATFFNAIKGLFPTAVTWNVPTTGDIIEITNGHITAAWTGGTGATIAGTVAGSYVAGTGAFVRWSSSQIRGTRRMRGRTFLCPLATGSFDSAGTLVDANVTTMQNAAVALAGTGTLQIWGRPRGVGGSDGQAGLVTGAQVPDKVTSLRTRRV